MASLPAGWKGIGRASQSDQQAHPGAEIKTLLVERTSGLGSSLMRMDLGAVLPDHEHLMFEKTRVLEAT